MTGLTGYKLHYGFSSGVYSETIDVGLRTSLRLANLQDGTTYYFTVTAVGSGFAESAFSDEIVWSTAANQPEQAAPYPEALEKPFAETGSGSLPQVKTAAPEPRCLAQPSGQRAIDCWTRRIQKTPGDVLAPQTVETSDAPAQAGSAPEPLDSPFAQTWSGSRPQVKTVAAEPQTLSDTHAIARRTSMTRYEGSLPLGSVPQPSEQDHAGPQVETAQQGSEASGNSATATPASLLDSRPSRFRPVEVITHGGLESRTSGWAAIDGDLETAWCGQSNAEGWWVLLAYEQDCPVTELEIVWADPARPAPYTVLASRDAEEWFNLQDAMDTSQGPVSLSYLWIIFPDDGTGICPGLREIYVR